MPSRTPMAQLDQHRRDPRRQASACRRERGLREELVVVPSVVHRSPSSAPAFNAPWWLWQVPTTLLFLTTAALLVVASPPRGVLVAAGVAVLLALGVVVVAASGRLLDGPAALTLPLVDVVAAGLLHGAGSTATWSTILAVGLPAAWLAYTFGRAGAVLAVGSVLVVAVAPFAAGRSVDEQGLLDVVLPAAALAGMAAVTYGASQALTAARAASTAHAAALELQVLTNDSVLAAVDVGVAVFVPGRRPVLNRRARSFYALTRATDGPGTAPVGLEAEQDAEPHFHVYGHDRTTRLPAAEQAHARAMAGETFTGLLQWLGPPGEQVAVACSAQQMRDQVGTERGTVFSGWDATELLDSVRVREEFLGTVSHELRTPLTSIIGYLEVVEDEVRGPRTDAGGDLALAHLAVVRRNASALQSRVEQLLDEATTRDVAPRTQLLDVATLVRSSVTRHREAAVQAGLQLALSCPSTLTAAVDPVSLDRVLDNLLTNAVKYTAQGRIDVALEAGALGRADEPSPFVLRVADTGMGMDEVELRHVFERFYRADAATRNAVPGIGIGLAITKRLVEAHRGTIVMRSRPGVGSTVEAFFPGVPGAEPQPPADDDPVGPPPGDAAGAWP